MACIPLERASRRCVCPGLPDILHAGGRAANLAVDRQPGGKHPADNHQQPSDESNVLDQDQGEQ